MNKRGCLWMVAVAGILVLFRAVLGCFYTVNQTEQVIITQFGQPQGEPITEPGLHLKLPFIQEVNRIDKRFLEWDGLPVAIPTRDKTYIHVDTYARWRIDVWGGGAGPTPSGPVAGHEISGYRHGRLHRCRGRG